MEPILIESNLFGDPLFTDFSNEEPTYAGFSCR
jgi:hypothetical protein